MANIQDFEQYEQELLNTYGCNDQRPIICWVREQIVKEKELLLSFDTMPTEDLIKKIKGKNKKEIEWWKFWKK